eukprot:1997377-Pleurochrysis_carterae.AAC.3
MHIGAELCLENSFSDTYCRSGNTALPGKPLFAYLVTVSDVDEGDRVHGRTTLNSTGTAKELAPSGF